jgi:hypothetical protein
MGHIPIQMVTGERLELHKVYVESSTEKHVPESTNYKP